MRTIGLLDHVERFEPGNMRNIYRMLPARWIVERDG
jgi:hypothetical protein